MSQSTESVGEYFSSYADLGVHRLMLQDQPRTEAYRKAIEDNASLFAGKIVLEVGCGTGILSMFAARAGAAKVYAVEASDMAKHAKELVKRNGMSETIEVIQSLVENVELPTKVDIIISEWMGFYLLHESMLPAVFVARDKWLAPGGLLFPQTCRIYAAPVSMDKYIDTHFSFWSDVYGFDFSSVVPEYQQTLLSKPAVQVLEPEQVLGEPCLVLEVDCSTAKEDDLEFACTPCEFLMSKAGTLQGIALWFDVTFPCASSNEAAVVLDTSPFAPPTHWMQTTIVLPEGYAIEANNMLPLHVVLLRDTENRRHYQLSLSPEPVERPVTQVLHAHGHQPDCSCTTCTLIKVAASQYQEQ